MMVDPVRDYYEEKQRDAERGVAQVGGDHYQAEYQHWDWVHDVGLDYFGGNASKYIARARRKGNEKQDLEKALSYVRKAQSLGICYQTHESDDTRTERLAVANDLKFSEYMALCKLTRGMWQDVAARLEGRLVALEQGA